MKIRILCLVLTLMAGCDTGTESVNKAAETVSAPSHGIIELFEVGDDVYVRSLAVEESKETLWVGTSLGVHEIDLKNQGLVNTFTREDGLANEYVFAIGIDPDGYKWFGTNAGGMSRYKDGEWKVYFPVHGLADYWIYAFANDPDGGLWIGTWAGVNYLNRETGELKLYLEELINEWVYGIGIDTQGRVWFGTEGGISMYDREAWQSWTHADGLGAENTEDLPFSKNTGLGTRARHDLGVMSDGRPTYNPNYVFSILVDDEDMVWAGTWGGGVSRYENGQWKNYTTEDGLAGNIVYSMAQDEDGFYWFGTNQGLSRFDGKNWQNFNVHQGLPNNHVYAIAPHKNGDVWAGTRGAVVRLGYSEGKD